jgi:hypothetical protein
MMRQKLPVIMGIAVAILLLYSLAIKPGVQTGQILAASVSVQKDITAVDDDWVQRYKLQLWSNTGKSNTFGDICGDFKGYGTSMRFPITVPAGAIVQTAYLVLVAEEASQQANALSGVRVLVRAENSYNPGPTKSYADHVSRVRTSSYSYWIIMSAWEAGKSYQTPSLKSSIQEVIDTNGGIGGNLVLFIEDPYFQSWDGRNRAVASVEHPSLNPPILHVEYTVEEAVSVTPGPAPAPTPDPVPTAGMQLRVKSVHHKVSPTGDVLEIGLIPAESSTICVPEYVVLVDYPITVDKIKEAIRKALPAIKAQFELDIEAIKVIEDSGLAEFNSNDI